MKRVGWCLAGLAVSSATFAQFNEAPEGHSARLWVGEIIAVLAVAYLFHRLAQKLSPDRGSIAGLISRLLGPVAVFFLLTSFLSQLDPYAAGSIEDIFLHRPDYSNWIRAIVAARLLTVTWIFSILWAFALGLVANRATRRDPRSASIVIPFTGRLGSLLIWIGGLLFVSTLYGYDIRALLTGLGIGGVAIALAAKDSIENLFGALTVVLDVPFGVGDWVKIGATDGIVEAINLRSTRVRTTEDSVITVPNSTLIKASVENLGARRHRRVKTLVTLSPPADSQDLTAFLEKARAELEGVAEIIPGSVFLRMFDIAADGVLLQLVANLDVSTYEDELRVRENLLVALLHCAGQNNLRIGRGAGALP